MTPPTQPRGPALWPSFYFLDEIRFDDRWPCESPAWDVPHGLGIVRITLQPGDFEWRPAFSGRGPDLCPLETTTYTIRGFDAEGNLVAQGSATLTVIQDPNAPEPAVLSITATPKEVEWGGCATLKMSVSGRVEEVRLVSPPLDARLSDDGSEAHWETTVCLVETRIFAIEALDARFGDRPDDMHRLSESVTVTVGLRPDGPPACVAPVATAGSPRAADIRVQRDRIFYGSIGGYRIPISLRAGSGRPAVIDFYHANAVVDWRARRVGRGWEHDLVMWMSNHDETFPHSDCPEEGLVPGFKARLCPGTDEVSSVVCDPSGCRWGGGDEAPSCFVQEGSTR